MSATSAPPVATRRPIHRITPPGTARARWALLTALVVGAAGGAGISGALVHSQVRIVHDVRTLWLNADGSLLVATADRDSHVELWDTRTGQRCWRVDIGYPAGKAMTVSPNGRTLLIGTFNGAVVLLDIASGRVLAHHTLRLSAQIWSADFAPDGGVVALGGDDGQVHLLTGDTLREIGQLPIGAGATWALAAYSADGWVLSAVDERGRIVRWDTRPETWIRRACAVVARDLTPAEWDTYLPGVPRRQTCTAG